MENGLQKTSHSLSLSDRQTEIASFVVEVNMLIPYALTDSQIIDWSRNIDRLVPDLDLDVLAKILDDFKLDVLEWDRTKGIQNILRELSPKGYTPETTN